MAFFLCLILFGIFLQSESQRHFTIDDYFKVKGISDIQISPDGTKIAFVKRELIPDEDKKGELKRKRDIYMVTIADNEIYRLTSHEKDSSTPRWSHDGKHLFFFSNRTGKSQLWMLDMERGGEGQQLTDWEPGIGEFMCSPDSTHIAFISRDPKEKKGEENQIKAKKDDPYVITRTNYLYDGSGYFGDPREWRHIWVISLNDPKNPQKITDGEFDNRDLEWSPDALSPSPLCGQKMPFFKVKFEPAFNDFTVPTTMSKKRGSESRYKPRYHFDSCQTLCPIPASRAVETS